MKRVCVAILVLVMAAIPTTVRADVAPPAQPPGSTILPGSETTQVRMLAETVELDVEAGTGQSLGRARVSADFIMHNTGAAAESMAARFPLAASDGFSTVKEIHDLQVSVDGRAVGTRRITGEDPYGGSDPVAWSAFDVTFAPGQDVLIQVRYTLEASGEYPFIWFKYILSSGAGWKDTIGSADIIVRLPYQASDENLLIDSPDSYFGTTANGALDGDTIRWHYSDLEPQTQDNFEVNLVMPSAWQRLLAEQHNVAANPRDGEAWGRLGKVSKELAFSSRGKGFRGGSGELDAGAARLFEQSLQAYDKAVTLLPNDGEWHAGYADLLSYYAYFAAFNGEDTRQQAAHSLREIQLALALAPTNAKVKQIAEQISFMFPDGMRRPADQYEYPWLTATPALEAPSLSAPPTAEVAQVPTTPAELTATPPPTLQPHPAPTAKPSTPICGSIGLAPLAALVVGFSALKRKPKA